MMSGGPQVDEEQLKQIFGDEAKQALAMYTEARADSRRSWPGSIS